MKIENGVAYMSEEEFEDLDSRLQIYRGGTGSRYLTLHGYSNRVVVLDKKEDE